MLDRLRSLVKAKKAMSGAPVWRIDGQRLILVVPLEIDGVVEEGLRLRVAAHLKMPDRDAVFQVEYHPSRQPGGPIARIEWQPRNGHNNRGLGPKEYRFRTLLGSHDHPFDLNAKLGFPAMVLRNLPIAVPLEPEPENFAEVLVVVRDRFKITNASSIPMPPWDRQLDFPI